MTDTKKNKKTPELLIFMFFIHLSKKGLIHTKILIIQVKMIDIYLISSYLIVIKKSIDGLCFLLLSGWVENYIFNLVCNKIL